MQPPANLGVLARARLVFSRFWTGVAHPEPQPDHDPALHFDARAAWREGWTVSECGLQADGSACIQLQRIDLPLDGSAPAFASDGDAWLHVVAYAREGSLLHRAALALVDHHERTIIDAACGPWLTCPD